MRGVTGSWRFKATAFAFLCCVTLGGGTRPGFLSDAVLQFACVPILCLALWRLPDGPWSSGSRLAVALCGAVVALPLLQLIPLPLDVWKTFAVRAKELSVFELMGAAPSMLPITVSREATVLSALALIPPVTLFLSMLQHTAEERRLLTLLFVGFGVASAFLGLAQLSQGANSPLRFFEITNAQDAVGMFANRNHFATFINCAIVFTIAWTLDVASSPRRDGSRRTVIVILGLSAIVVLIAATMMARSRAGVAGTAIAVIAGFALAFRVRRGSASLRPIRVLAGTVVFGLVLTLQYALFQLADRFAVDPLKDARTDFARTTFEAIKAYFPFGSGIGTFTRVYPSFEKPQQALLDTFVNRAHNDFLEFTLEAGLPGGIVVAAICLLAALIGWHAWTRADAEARLIDATLARAAAISLAIIALHSALDYPLRTSAIMAVAALSFALLFEAPAPKRSATIRAPVSNAATVPVMKVEPDTSDATPVNTPASERKAWGAGIEWPEEWRKK